MGRGRGRGPQCGAVRARWGLWACADVLRTGGESPISTAAPLQCETALLASAGVILCLERALANSGLSPSDVNYVNAHATSTQVGVELGGHVYRVCNSIHSSLTRQAAHA